MAHIIIDRRKTDKNKSSVNRHRFVKRVRSQVREAVRDSIRNGKIADIGGSKDKKISIPGKGLNQPTFSHDSAGGIKDKVFPGNKEFQKGDRIPRPPEGGGGQGGNASDSGEGEDNFTFSLTKKEFLDIFFEDLGLPNLDKRSIVKVDDWENRRAGFSTDGNPSRLNILRSMRTAKGRLLSLRSPKKKKIKLLEAQLIKLQVSLKEDNLSKDEINKINDQIDQILLEIAKLKRKYKAVPFIDDMDLRYNRWELVPIPSTQAVMFAIMDVSGSMGDWEKEMAKRFFMLLYLFLERNYEKVEIVFIRHHTVASEVDEEEFFYSKETGGTLVSTGLDKMLEIANERYPKNLWNIYVCQASDGDNWSTDSLTVQDLLTNHILPIVQYYAYVEIKRDANRSSDLWEYYEKIASSSSNLAMAVIDDISKIFDVFAGLFKKND